MHPRLHLAILGGALAALLLLERSSAAHFLLIYPEADDDRPVVTADAAWPSPPAKSAHGESPASKKKSIPLPPSRQKSGTRVVPLKRERPKNETDPPKTRRRQLGW